VRVKKSEREVEKLKTLNLQLIFTRLIFTFALLSSSVLWAFSPDDDLSARALLLMDAKTGKILYQKDADVRLPPASTTKVLTAILTLESHKRFNDLLTVSKAATRVPASKLYLKPGQTVSVEDLLYGVLLASANDASVVLAEGIGGSVERFAEFMTKKAHDLGATNTHFSNPHGLTAADHYSTARDLALIFRYAMRNPIFRQIVHTKMSSVRSVSAGKRSARARLISVRNHNRLLWNYDGAIGGKTGYTFAAQKCFVGAVERNGITLIVSLLGSRDLWGDTKRLLEYGFDNYEALNTTPARGRSIAEQQATPRTTKLSALTVSPHDETASKASPDGYILQIGSFREQHRAEALLKAFSDKGFEVFVEKTALNDKGETSYRVRLGPYTQLSEAQQIVQEVFKESGHRAIILPNSTSSDIDARSQIEPPL
jgi:serine-type D-Ala-D-Ala carboxypeptidase (penicillin-binding protein 5/6)